MLCTHTQIHVVNFALREISASSQDGYGHTQVYTQIHMVDFVCRKTSALSQNGYGYIYTQIHTVDSVLREILALSQNGCGYKYIYIYVHKHPWLILHLGKFQPSAKMATGIHIYTPIHMVDLYVGKFQP